MTRYGATTPEITVAYNDASKVLSVANQLGATTYTYGVSGNERWTKITNPLGKSRTYTFYENDYTSGVDTYNVAERMKSISDEFGATPLVTTYAYTPQGYLSSVTYPKGNTVTFTYDTRGNPKTTTRKGPTGSTIAPMVSTAEYETNCSGADRFGLTVTDANCNLPRQTSDEHSSGSYNYTDYRYNPDGTVARVTLPAPSTGAVRPETRYTYQTLAPTGGQAVTLLVATSRCRTLASCAGTADEQVQTTTYATTRNLLPTGVTVKAGDNSISATVTSAWDPIGNLVSTTSPVPGATTQYLYEARRRVVGVIGPDPDGAGALKPRAARLSYGADWSLDSAEAGTVPEGATDLALFAPFAKVEYSRYVNGTPTVTARSMGGRVFGVTHAQLTPTGQISCVAERLNPAAWGTYTSACGRQADGPDGRDRLTRWQYDDVGRVTSVTHGYMAGANLVSTDTYTYTANGLVGSATDGAGNRTGYAYDDLDRVVETHYPDKAAAGVSSATDYEKLTYDARGLVSDLRTRDGTIHIGYGYDLLGRLTSKTRPAVGSNGSFGYGYDNFGDIVSATSSWPTITRTFDALGRLTGESSTWLKGLAWEYDAAGRRTKQSWDDGVSASYAYLATGELKTVSVMAAGATTALATYDYDDLGRRVKLTRGAGVLSATYGYADAGGDTPYLTSLFNDLAALPNDLTSSFTYTLAGQIKSVTRVNPTDKYAWQGHYNVDRPYAINGLNQVTSAGSGAGHVTFGYDARGNLTSSGSQAFTYAAENELASVGPGTELVHDPFGRLEYVSDGARRCCCSGRVARSRPSWGGTARGARRSRGATSRGRARTSRWRRTTGRGRRSGTCATWWRTSAGR